jgi:hypothetical protein
MWPSNNSGGGSAPTVQTLTPAQAVSPGITISAGSNVVELSPAISSNVSIALNGGGIGDTLKLLMPMSGEFDVIVDGKIVSNENAVAGTQCMLDYTRTSAGWIMPFPPIWI